MQLVERHILRDKSFYDICVKAKNLYNQSLYYWRQSIFGNIQYFSEYELSTLFIDYNEENYRNLPSQTSQQIIKNLFKNIKSWQKARKEYNKNPEKFLGKPKMPKYKKETSIVFFTSQQIRVKDGCIHFPKITNLPIIKTMAADICQVRIIPNSDHCIIEVVYNKEEKHLREYNGNWMGIDLGMNNLATAVTKNSAFIFNGKPLKAINHFYNKRKAKLQSKLPNGQYTSRRIERLTYRRNRKIEDKIHKTSSQIIKLAENENITKIIIGNNKNWKQNINIGAINNRRFTSIPHTVLLEKIKYKGFMEGIEVISTQEAYTSKCSALDLETIQKHETYVGRRKKRGLFRTKEGRLINADVNGACNIARLVAGDEIITDSVRSIASMPKVMNIFAQNANIIELSLKNKRRGD